MKLANQAVVLVADSEKMLLLHNQGDEAFMDLRVLAHEERTNPPTREQGADKPGRQQAIGGRKSSLQATDWHRLAKSDAARKIGSTVDTLAKNGREIVLVLDAATLGEVRPLLCGATRDCVTLELTKDLSNHPVVDIEHILGAA